MRLIVKMVDGEELDFNPTATTVIVGRSPKCEVVIPSEGVSRQHCKIEVRNGDIFITDLGSTNGVIIDGDKINPHQETPYSTFLTLSFGSVSSMQIELDEKTSFINRPATNTVTASATTNSSSGPLTKTVRLERPAKAAAPQSAQKEAAKTGKKKEEISQTQFKIMVILVIVGLITLAVMFKGGDEAAPEEGPAVETKEIVI